MFIHTIALDLPGGRRTDCVIVWLLRELYSISLLLSLSLTLQTIPQIALNSLRAPLVSVDR